MTKQMICKEMLNGILVCEYTLNIQKNKKDVSTKSMIE